MLSLHHSNTFCRKTSVVKLPKIVAITMLSPPPQLKHKCFKERRSLTLRKQESNDVKEKFPRKVPIIVEKFDKERVLPDLDKTKFIVPDDMTMSQFVSIVRSRLRLKSTQTLYLLVRSRCLTTLSRTVAEVYWEHQDDDGFLYTTYTAQEVYG